MQRVELLFSAIAEMERDIINERHREGIVLVKSRNLYHGRKPISVPSNFSIYYEKYKKLFKIFKLF